MIDTIAHLCRAADRLSKMQGWRLAGVPVVTYEFTDPSRYYAARADLIRAMNDVAHRFLLDQRGRYEPERVDDRTEEIKCSGIIFRLVLLSAPGRHEPYFHR